MLGIGPDGHVASLFPGHPALDVDDRVAVGVTDSPKPPPERITLTFGALNRAAAVWFLVSGGARPRPSPAPSPTAPPTSTRSPPRGVTGSARDRLVPRPRPPPPTSDHASLLARRASLLRVEVRSAQPRTVTSRRCAPTGLHRRTRRCGCHAPASTRRNARVGAQNARVDAQNDASSGAGRWRPARGAVARGGVPVERAQRTLRGGHVARARRDRAVEQRPRRAGPAARGSSPASGRSRRCAASRTPARAAIGSGGRQSTSKHGLAGLGRCPAAPVGTTPGPRRARPRSRGGSSDAEPGRHRRRPAETYASRPAWSQRRGRRRPGRRRRKLSHLGDVHPGQQVRVGCGVRACRRASCRSRRRGCAGRRSTASWASDGACRTWSTARKRDVARQPAPHVAAVAGVLRHRPHRGRVQRLEDRPRACHRRTSSASPCTRAIALSGANQRGPGVPWMPLAVRGPSGPRRARTRPHRCGRAVPAMTSRR